MPGKGKKRQYHTYESVDQVVINGFPVNPLPAGQNDDKLKLDDFNGFVTWFRAWAADLESWGQDMRDDLIRLEGQAGFPTGDPGDPPGGPPE